MSTQPRISAPIGRVRIRTSSDGKRRASGSGQWRAVDPPMTAEVTEADEASADDGPLRFYPFPLHTPVDNSD